MLESTGKSLQQTTTKRPTPEVRAKSAPQLGLDWDWAGTGAELSNIVSIRHQLGLDWDFAGSGLGLGLAWDWAGTGAELRNTL